MMDARTATAPEPVRPACKIRVKTGHFINFYIGRAVQVGIASGFKSVE